MQPYPIAETCSPLVPSVRFCMGSPSPTVSSFADSLIDPLQDEVGDLQTVLVLHDHVAVAVDPALRRVEHLRAAARTRDAANEGLTGLETSLPGGQRRKARRRVAVVAEDDEYRHLRQAGDVLGRLPGRAAARLDEHETRGSRWIDSRRVERDRS